MPEDSWIEEPVDVPHAGSGDPLAARDSRPARSTTARILIWLLLLLAFGVAFWLVLHRPAAQAKAATKGKGAPTGPVTVTAATARKGDIGVYLDAIGTVTPVYTDSITSQVTGLISVVHYKEGQIVQRGDPLIEIDAQPYIAQLQEAQGTLKRDTNLLAEAQMDLDRYRTAWAGDGIAKQTLDDQEKLVLQDEGTVELDQGTVKYDQVEVNFCHLTAPISGRVGLRLVDPGNVVTANSTTPLVVIAQLQPITVVFTIAEDNISEVEDQMRTAKTLEVTAYDRSNQAKLAAGKLQTIDNLIDTTTGTVKLRALFANQNNALFPNSFVNTKLKVKTLQGVTLIPSSAIQQNGETSYVYVIQDDTAHLRSVKPGVSDSGMTSVEGIDPGDVVANSSFEKLQDDSKVVIAETPPAPSASEGGEAAP
jgi:membrane fusion protein, multidrug efflux system